MSVKLGFLNRKLNCTEVLQKRGSSKTLHTKLCATHSALKIQN